MGKSRTQSLLQTSRVSSSLLCLTLAILSTVCIADETSSDLLNDFEWTKYYQPSRCGPIALYCVCKFYNISTTIDELANLSGYNPSKGTSIAGLVQAAKVKKLNALALESNIGHLRTRAGPAIVDFPQGHFCVFLGWKGGDILILDPPHPSRTVTVDTFLHDWGKHLLVFDVETRPETNQND